MGVHMQIVYLGFNGSSALEAEAGAQLVRIERFCGLISGCRLAIEKLYSDIGLYGYDARLDLVMRNGALQPVRRFTSSDAKEALRKAFVAAERGLLVLQNDGTGQGRRIGQRRGQRRGAGAWIADRRTGPSSRD